MVVRIKEGSYVRCLARGWVHRGCPVGLAIEIVIMEPGPNVQWERRVWVTDRWRKTEQRDVCLSPGWQSLLGPPRPALEPF